MKTLALNTTEMKNNYNPKDYFEEEIHPIDITLRWVKISDSTEVLLPDTYNVFH